MKRSPRRELLNEYASHLVKYHPHLKHEVLSKLQHLNKQWRSIEFSIVSKHYFNQEMTKGTHKKEQTKFKWKLIYSFISKDIEQDLKNFEFWLEKVEKLIENLTLDAEWSANEIEIRLNEHKRMFQSDIESHSKIINSVLKLSNKLKQSCTDCSHFYETGIYLLIILLNFNNVNILDQKWKRKGGNFEVARYFNIYVVY